MNERFDDLMFRQLCGALSTEEKEELASTLDGDPAARREFVLFMEQQTDIAECLAVKTAVSAMRRPVPLPVTRTRFQSRSRSPFLAMAALLAVMAAVMALFHFREIAHARTPVVTRISGSVDRVGESVSTGAESSALLTYPDGTVVELAADTILQVSARSWSDRSKGLDLVTGRLSADVMPQIPGSPMILSSADARAEIVGTKLSLQHDDEGTRLEVIEGEVRFIPRSGGAELLVASGAFAEAGKSGVLSGAFAAPLRRGIVRFTLMNADTDEPLREAALNNGEIISLAALPTRNINIRADYEGAAPTAVRLLVNRHDGQPTGMGLNNTADQTQPPFFVAGDYWAEGRPNDCRAWTPQPGGYRITATAFYGGDGGERSRPLELDFQVTE